MQLDGTERYKYSNGTRALQLPKIKTQEAKTVHKTIEQQN